VGRRLIPSVASACCLVVSAGIVLAPPTSASAAGADFTVTPEHRKVIPGEYFSFTGRLPTHHDRVVKLQWLKGATWETVTAYHSDAGGRFELADRGRMVDFTYRVKAPAADWSGQHHRALISNSVTVRSIAPTVALTAEPRCVAEGETATLSAVSWPGRPGKKVNFYEVDTQLPAASVKQDGSGRASYELTPSEAGDLTFVAASGSSTTNYRSAAVVVGVAPTSPTEAVQPPAGLDLRALTNKVKLSWCPAGTGLDGHPTGGYNVYRAGSPDGPWVLLTPTPTLVSRHVADGLAAGDEAYFRVTTVDLEGHESSPASFHPAAGPAPLAVRRTNVPPAGFRPVDFSRHGRYVVGEGRARLVDADNNNSRDVYLLDTKSGKRFWISRPRLGAAGGSEPSVSGNGDVVAFVGAVRNNRFSQILVRDRAANTTALISASPQGKAGTSWSVSPSVSRDGRYVAFRSKSKNLVAGDVYGSIDAFVYDRKTGSLKRVLTDSASGMKGLSPRGLVLSGDGQTIAYESVKQHLTPEPPTGRAAIFVTEVSSGITRRVGSTQETSATGGRTGVTPRISDDGRFVVYPSHVFDELPFWAPADSVLLRTDLADGVTEAVSASSEGLVGRSVGWFDVSANGRRVVFQSIDPWLVAGDFNGSVDTFVRDVRTSTTRRVSADTTRRPGGGVNDLGCAISPDAAVLAWSGFDDLARSGDRDYDTDLFIGRAG
jgi:hypothetical protein